MQKNGFHHLLAEGNHGIEGGHGFLKNHGNIIAADIAHFLGRELGQIYFPEFGRIEDNFSRSNLARILINKTQNCQSTHRLTGARLAHNTKRFAFFDSEIDVFYRLYHSFFGLKLDSKIPHFEQQVLFFCICMHGLSDLLV